MKRKSFYLFVLLSLLWGGVQAQNARPVSRTDMTQRVSLNRWYMNQLMIETGQFVGPMDRDMTISPAAPAVETATGTELEKTSAVSIQRIANATNAYTILRQSQNQLVADNDLNMVTFIHRQSLDDVAPGPAPPTTSNGISRLSVSTNRGTSWTQNIGPLNPVPYPNTARGRFPQVAYYRPNNTTDINDVQFAWVSPCTDGSNWGNYMWGNASSVLDDLNGAPHGSNFVDPAAKFSFLGTSQDNPVLLPGGLCMGRPGEFWTHDIGFSSNATTDSTILFKGVYNQTTGEVDWAYHRSFKPPYRKSPQNGRPYWASNPTVDFAPDGLTGWTCIMGTVNLPQRPNDVSINPILYKTTDGGDTWTGPYVVYLNDYEAIGDSLYRRYRVKGSQGQDSTFFSSGVAIGFNFDLRVDASGNPHVFTEVMNAADSSYVDGEKIGANTITFTFGPALYKAGFDITTCDGGRTWQPKFITELVKYSGTIPGSGLGLDTRLKISRSEDGNVMFYSWSDDTLRTRENNQMQPSLWHRAIRVTDEAAIANTITPMTGVNASFNNRVFYPTTSPTVLDQGGIYTIPTVFMQLPFNNENLRAEFYYINGREVAASALAVPTRNLAITAVTAPSDNVCATGLQDVTVTVRNNGTVAIDSFSVTYYLEGAQADASWRRATVKLGSPLAPNATHNVTLNATTGFNQNGVTGGRVNFAASGTYNLIARVSADRDYVECDNIFIKRIVVNGGNGNIFATATAEDCGEITLNTGLSNNGSATVSATWFVEEGANNFVAVGSSAIAAQITVNGQSLRYAPPVSTSAYTQTFRVEVNSSSCGVSTDDIDVTINPVPTINLQVKQGSGTIGNINSGSLTNVSLVSGKYQVCGAGGNRLYVQVADTTVNTQYRVTWYRGTEAITANQFSTNNFQGFSEPGPYTMVLRDNVTGCTVEQTYNFRIWNIALDLSSVSQNLCFHKTNLLNASNASTGTFGDVRYQWSVTTLPHAQSNLAATYPGDDTTYIRESLNSTYPLLWPNQTENLNLNTRTARYRVRAWDGDSLCSNSTNAPTVERTITAWDSTAISFTNDIPADGRLCVYDTVTATNTTSAGLTPITHRWWTIAPSNRLEVVEGSLGTPASASAQGSSVLKVSTRTNSYGFTGNRTITLITCSAPSTANNTTTSPSFINNVGCCDTLRLQWAALLNGGTDANNKLCAPVGRANRTDISSMVDVFPNPNNGRFDIVSSFATQTPVIVEIMDARGTLVMQREMLAVGAFDYTVDLTTQASGIYMLRLLTPEGVAHKRIVKQ